MALFQSKNIQWQYLIIIEEVTLKFILKISLILFNLYLIFNYLIYFPFVLSQDSIEIIRDKKMALFQGKNIQWQYLIII